MTIAWSNKPKPPLADPTVVVCPSGTSYSCPDVAACDAHIKLLQFKLQVHRERPKRLADIWQDIDELLGRRQALSLETWLSPSDIPL